MTANPNYNADEGSYGAVEDSLLIHRYAYDDEGKAFLRIDFEIQNGQEIPTEYWEIECDDQGNPTYMVSYDTSQLGDSLYRCYIDNTYDENNNLIEFTTTYAEMEANGNRYSETTSREYNDRNELIYEESSDGGEYFYESKEITLDKSGNILKKVLVYPQGESSISYEYLDFSKYKKHHINTLEGTSWNVISGMDQGSTVTFSDYNISFDDGNSTVDYFYKVNLPCHLFVDKNDGEGEQHSVFFNFYEDGHDYLLIILGGTPCDYVLMEKK